MKEIIPEMQSKTNYWQQLRHDIAKAIRWLEIGLQLVGMWWVVTFIRVNIYGKQVVMQMPDTPVFVTTVISEELEEYLIANERKDIRSSK